MSQGVRKLLSLKIVSLLRVDAISVLREPVFLINIVFGAFCPYLIWQFQEQINSYAERTFNLENFTLYLMPFGLLLPAILIGWVTGMLLLEDRDDKVLNSVEVTPVGRRGYFVYRMGIAFLISVGISIFSLTLLYPASKIVMAYLSIMAGLESVIVSLCLVALAGNKVEGLALSKILNCMALFPLLALIDGPMRFLAAVLPSFWVGEQIFNGQNDYLPLLGAPIAITIHLITVIFIFKIANVSAI